MWITILLCWNKLLVCTCVEAAFNLQRNSNKNQLIRMGLNQYMPSAATCLLSFDVDSLTSLTGRYHFNNQKNPVYTRTRTRTRTLVYTQTGTKPQVWIQDFVNQGRLQRPKLFDFFVNNHNTTLTHLSTTNSLIFDHSHHEEFRKKSKPAICCFIITKKRMSMMHYL